ncbi:hypothetical protein ACFO1B_55450 [Dactylosporangium siamense]|uniref:hypothetical protein n=1 Tax=Dactylosporangium siamense TaxID=685454 RepID=UPI0019452253|nr:hypothetical protein [Dactylosporangium siamense]
MDGRAELEQLCRAAGDTRSVQHLEARSRLASIWAATRDPELRAAVLATGALADGPERLVTAALQGRLTAYWSAEQAHLAWQLLTDADPDVRRAAEDAICRARPALHAALCSQVASPERASDPGGWWASPLGAALCRHPVPPPAALLDKLWRAWFAAPHETLRGVLVGWGTPAAAADLRPLSELFLAGDAAMPAAMLVEAAGRDHPIAAVAQRVILSRPAPDLIDEVCTAALADERLVAFVEQHGMQHSDPLRQRLYRLLGRIEGQALPAGIAGAVREILLAAGADLDDRLWAASAAERDRPGRHWWRMPVTAVLLQHAQCPPTELLDRLWRSWLGRPRAVLWRALERWAVPASDRDLRGLSQVAVLPRDALVPVVLWPAVLRAARATGHPIRDIALRRVLESDDPGLAEALSLAALTDETLREFCDRHDVRPVHPLRRAIYRLLTVQQPTNPPIADDLRTDVVAALQQSGEFELAATLWRVLHQHRDDRWWCSPLAETLLDAGAGPSWVADELWPRWLQEPEEAVLRTVRRCELPIAEDVRAVARLVLEPDSRHAPTTLVTCATRGHPVKDLARQQIARRDDPMIAEAVWRAALLDADLLAFCVECGIAPEPQVPRDVFELLCAGDLPAPAHDALVEALLGDPAQFADGVWRAAGLERQDWWRGRVAALLHEQVPPVAIVSAAWRSWLADPAEDLWQWLLVWARPGSDKDVREISRLVLDPLGVHARDVVLDCLGRDHPVAAVARRNVVECNDPDVRAAVWRAALTVPSLMDLCAANDIQPVRPLERDVFGVLATEPLPDQVRDVLVRALLEDRSSFPASVWRAAGLERPDWWRGRLAALLSNRRPPTAVHSQAWRSWLADPDEELLRLLLGWRTPAEEDDVTDVSRLMLRPLEVRPIALLTDYAAREHPVAAMARRSILERNDAAVNTAVWRAALTEPGLVDFCIEHGIVPGPPLPRAAFDLVLADRQPPLPPAARDGIVAALRTDLESFTDTLWQLAAPDGQITDASAAAPMLSVLLAGDPGPLPPHRLNALWQLWLQAPDDVVWSALQRCGLPATDHLHGLSLVALDPDSRRLCSADLASVLVAAGYADHPIAGIAHGHLLAVADPQVMDRVCAAALTSPVIAEFCRRYRFAPQDPVRQALFYVVTGQPEQKAAVDPDDRLLNLAYASADAEERSVLRQAMLRTDNLDMVRVLVGNEQRDRLRSLTDSELDYLAEQLAHRQRWSELWQILLDLPVLHAVQLSRLIHEDWHPGDRDAAALLAQLQTADTHHLTQGIAAIRASWPAAAHQATIRFPGRVNDVCFAPDAAQLAVAGSRRMAGVVDLVTGSCTAIFKGFHYSLGRTLHVGGDTFLAGERTNSAYGACRLVRCGSDGWTTIGRIGGWATALVPLGADRFAAADRAGRVHIGATDGSALTSTPVRELGFGFDEWPRSLASNRTGSRLAVLGRELVILDAATGSPVAHGHQRTVVVRALMPEPDLLVTATQQGHVRQYRIDGDALLCVAETFVSGLVGMAAVPSRQQIAVVSGAGRLTFLDQSDLSKIAEMPWAPFDIHTSLDADPHGNYLAAGCAGGSVVLFDLRIADIPEAVGEPLARMAPMHLGVVQSATQVAGLTAHSRELLDLIRACLEHRFRFDIELADTTALAAGDYTIAID